MADTLTPSTPTRRYRVVQNITLTVVLLFLILMAVISIAWLLLNPHEPNFRVSSLSVSNFSVSDSQLRGKYDIGFTISNPNKKIEVFLDDFNVVVYYGKVRLSEGTVQPISLGKMREKSLKVYIVMKVDSPKLVKTKVFAGVGDDWKKGVVNFNVRMEVRIRFEAGNWPTSSKLLDLYCGDLDVFFGPKVTGKLLGVGKDCHV